MRILVSGGSASGKSKHAEDLTVALCKPKQPLYYIATMIPYGAEAQERIERHRLLRLDKGFETVECYQSSNMPDLPAQAVVLLECVGNMLANEMYLDESFDPQRAQDVLRAINALASTVEHLIVVTNDIASDGIVYDEDTKVYQRQIGYINQNLAAWFDKVVEVVCSIPLVHKQSDAM